MNEHRFEFREADNGTWSWSGSLPGKNPLEEHGHPTLIDCVLAASVHGFTGDQGTYVVRRRPFFGRQSAQASG